MLFCCAYVPVRMFGCIYCEHGGEEYNDCYVWFDTIALVSIRHPHCFITAFAPFVQMSAP